MAFKTNEKIFKIAILFFLFLSIFILLIFKLENIQKAFLNTFEKEKIVAELDKTKNQNDLEENKTFFKNTPILISEVFLGDKNHPPFIKLFNFSDKEINLSQYTIKKISSSNTQSTLVSQNRFQEKIIKPFSYILISKENEKIKADVFWPKSYNISNSKGLILYKNKEKIDEVRWNKILSETAIKRISWEENNFAYVKIQNLLP